MDCDSATIPISSEYCNSRICSYYSENICQSTISDVAVYVSNTLGNGSSVTKNIDIRNNFVTTEFDLTVDPKIVTCIFHNPPPNGEKTCTITIGSSQIPKHGLTSTENTVTISLDGLGTGALSYNITASDGINYVVVQDIINLPRAQAVNSGGIAVGVIFAIIIVAVLLHIIIGCVVLALYHYWVSLM